MSSDNIPGPLTVAMLKSAQPSAFLDNQVLVGESLDHLPAEVRGFLRQVILSPEAVKTMTNHGQTAEITQSSLLPTS